MKRVSTVTVKKRLVTVFLFGLLAFIIIDFRLGYVQFIIGDELTDLADESWSRDITFEAERGHILDKNEEILAENVTAPSIILAPRQIDRKSTRLNSSHVSISYAVFCLKKKIIKY